MRFFGIVAAFAAAVFVTTTVAQSPKDDQAAERIDSIKRPAGERKADEWTKSRIKQARPTPLPKVNPQSVRAAAKTRMLKQQIPGSTEALNRASGQRYSGNVNSMPLQWAGKLVYTTPEGDSWCSAQFISPHVVLTAAHCVRDIKTGKFYENFAFELQYDDGNYSEKYPYECAATKNGWVQEGSEKFLYDFAMIRVGSESKTGHLGASWNWSGIGRATRIGYPQGNYDGERIQVDGGSISVDNGIVELRTQSRADPHGSSGGAWVADYSASLVGNRVIAVQSFIYDDFSASYGPQFNDSFKSLWDYAERGCR
jgi:V8-like Glu-specific endopeptidase